MKSMYDDMFNQLDSKELLGQVKEYAYEYIDQLNSMSVYPMKSKLEQLSVFDGPLPDDSTEPTEILHKLHQFGSPATVAQSGGKYFGFVSGGIIPVSMAAKWLTDVWDQNSGLFHTSPISSKLEDVCEKWVVELLGLPINTAAGFVSGTSVASICAIVAARNDLLMAQGYDVYRNGLFGAPEIRVVLGEQAHSSIWKALSMLGFGKDKAEIVPSDKNGAMIVSQIPKLDNGTLLIAQAGNANGGCFDDLEAICDLANDSGSWVHIDGAFGLWAAASLKRKHLTKGLEKADSWSADAHKTLNAPYDSGIVLCKNRDALVNAMRASGSYIQYSDHRDGMLYVPEMSKRSRAVELWAILKYLGKTGVASLVDGLCDKAVYFADKLKENGFNIANDVVFNQIIVKCETPQLTSQTLLRIQKSGECWCGGAIWENEPCIRISVCSWQTTISDIDECVKTFVACRKNVVDL